MDSNELKQRIDEIVLKPAQWQLDDYQRDKAQLLQLIERVTNTVIGIDDTDTRGHTQNPLNEKYHTKATKARNQLRAEQYQRLKELLDD